MKRFFKWVVRVFLAVLLLAVSAVAYLQIHGVPDFLKEFLISQLNRAGVACQFSSMRLDLLRGIVVTDAVLADARTPARPLARIDQVAVRWNWRGVLERRHAIAGLQIANANISVPTPPDELGSQQFTAEKAFANLLLQEDDSILVEQLTGVYCGIWLQISGRIKPSGAQSAEPLLPTPGKFVFLTKALRELNGIVVKSPPQLEVKFDIDLGRPLDSQVNARLHGTGLGYRGLVVDSATIDVAMRDGAIRFNQAVVQLYRGEVTVRGQYDIAQSRFDLEMMSTTDPTALAVVLPPAVAKVVREVHTDHNPKLTAQYTLSPEIGILPRLQGRVETAGVEFRTVAFRSIKFDFLNRGPEIWVTNAVITTAEGQLTGFGQYHIESSDFTYSLDSTINPCKLLPLMTRSMKRIVEPAWFATAPHIVASVTGDFVDPDNFGYDARVTAQGCSYRGVALRSAAGNLRLRRGQLDVQQLSLIRPDGEAHGQLLADFNAQRVSFALETTANPTALAPLLGEKAAEFMRPYQFGDHNAVQVRGMVDFFDPVETDWTAQLATEHARYRDIPIESISTVLALRQNRLSLTNLVLTTSSGTTRGKLLADLDTHRIAFELDSTANPTELAPFMGPRGADFLRPYRFGPRTKAHASGLVDFDDESQTAWTAQIVNEGFSYWRFTADKGQANLTLTNRTLRLDDVVFDFYGGKLRGRADFVLAATNSAYYFDFNADGSDLNKILTALRGTGKNVTGILSGQAQLRGHGSDLATLEGSGNLRVTDGVLWEAPLFGILSHILGTTKATDAKATFTIANQLVKTEDLMIAADPFTAECGGQFGFNGSLDFRVKAQFLRAWPGIGWIGRIIGEILEYKVGGSMAKPTYRSVKLPKELLPHDEEKQ